MTGISGARGWVAVRAAGTACGVLASIPALDGLLWRATSWVAWQVAPWLLLLAALAGLVAGLVRAWRGWR